MSAYISRHRVALYCCLKTKISHKFGCWVLPAANVNDLSQVWKGLIYIKVAWAIYTVVKHASKHIHWNYLLSSWVGRNDNMIGGAGAAAHRRGMTFYSTKFHIIPHNSTPSTRGGIQLFFRGIRRGIASGIMRNYVEFWSKSRKGSKVGLFHIQFHIIPHNSTCLFHAKRVELWSKSRKGSKAEFHVVFHMIPHNSTWAQVWTPDLTGASGIDHDPDEAEMYLGQSDLPLEDSTGDSTVEGSVISCVHTLFEMGLIRWTFLHLRVHFPDFLLHKLILCHQCLFSCLKQWPVVWFPSRFIMTTQLQNVNSCN